MPPTVRTPWLTCGCGLCVVLVGFVAGEPAPADLLCAPEPTGAPELFFPAEAVWPRGAAPLLTTCAPDGLPLLGDAGVPDGALLRGAALPEPLPEEIV